MSRKIRGDRKLSKFEVACINDLKDLEGSVLLMISAMKSEKTFDRRWIDIGNIQIEQGFMALIRSIAKPER